MANDSERVRLEQVDWQAVLPWLRLFRSFRMAIHPTKLLVGLMLVACIYLGGRVLDFAFGPHVYPGEIDQYRRLHVDDQTDKQFEAWIDGREAQAKRGLEQVLRSALGRKLAKAVGADTEDQQAVNKALEAYLAASDRFTFAIDAINAHYTSEVAFRRKLEEESAETAQSEAKLAEDLSQLRHARRASLDAIHALRPRGVFDATMTFSLDAFERLIRATVSFDFGWDQLAGSRRKRAPAAGGGAPDAARGVTRPDMTPTRLDEQTTVVAALRDLLVILPCWLYHAHPLFLALFLLGALLVISLLGGAIARMAALHATRDERIGAAAAIGNAGSHWLSYLLTPLMPLLLIAGMGLVLMVGGFLLFNLEGWGVDILGGLLFVVALVFGLAIALAVILSIAAAHLFYAAIAVDGADFFDAIARAFNYVLNRPWRWLFYNAMAMVYGAVTYLFLGMLVFLVLCAVHTFVGMWVFSDAEQGLNRFDAIFPEPQFGRLVYEVDWYVLDWSGRIAALLVKLWVFLTIGFLASYLVSYYYTVNTWIYLLLRRSADGVDLDDVYVDEQASANGNAGGASVPEKVEPTPDASSSAPPSDQ